MANTAKSELRKDVLARRSALDQTAISRDSAIIRQRLLRLPEWEDAGSVLCYVSMMHEVDTHKLIEEALGRRKRVIVPVISEDKQTGFLSELRSLRELSSSRIPGLFEHAPRYHRPAEPREVEVAIIPGVVFDLYGGRIGFGGGYFDRLLPQMPNCIRIGLAFSLQIFRQPLPVEEHDIRMHKIITEAEIILPRPTSSNGHSADAKHPYLA